jgi:hypothetical protein
VIAPAEQRVFRALDPYEAPFTDSVPARAILFPLSNPLTDEQFDAVVALARAGGDEGFLRIQYESGDEGEFVPLDDLAEARKPIGGPMAAFVSESGRWGILTDEDLTGLVAAADSELLAVLLDRWPATTEVRDHIRVGTELSSSTPGGVAARDQWRLFLRLWTAYKGVGDSVSWIPPILEHVYGRDRARQMLLEFPAIR